MTATLLARDLTLVVRRTNSSLDSVEVGLAARARVGVVGERHRQDDRCCASAGLPSAGPEDRCPSRPPTDGRLPATRARTPSRRERACVLRAPHRGHRGQRGTRGGHPHDQTDHDRYDVALARWLGSEAPISDARIGPVWGRARAPIRSPPRSGHDTLSRAGAGHRWRDPPRAIRRVPPPTSRPTTSTSTASRVSRALDSLPVRR